MDEDKIRLCKQGLSSLQHRGPDAENYYISNHVFLGHRRLSIIDLSQSANQPFFSSCGKAVIVFNGEIYNYKDLCQDLNLRTSSDTEVLLEGFLKHGSTFFAKIRGIYAFAIFDFRTPTPTVVLLRDPSGIKPLYVFHHEDELIFASEMKAIFPIIKKRLTIREDSICSYLHFGYIPEPYTIFEKIQAHPPGLLLSYSVNDGSCSKLQLNSFDFSIRNGFSFSANSHETTNLLAQAAERNLVSDVSLKVALSGGVDSSLLYAFCNREQPVGGITVAMNERQYDESDVAAVYSKHLQAPLEIITIEINNRIELLDRLLIHFDQPYADSSLVPFYFLSKAASAHTKVLIGGDGGDEIHNGYSGFKSLPVLMKLRQCQPKFFRSKMYGHGKFLPEKIVRLYNKGIGLLDSSSNNELLFKWGSWFPNSPKQFPFNPYLRNVEYKLDLLDTEDALNDESLIMKYYYHHRMQSDYLRKSDMMSMINSIEYRVPMLDEDLVRFSLSIPYNQKSDFRTTKKILRSIHGQIYPLNTSKMEKRGFSIPLDTWLGNENLEYIKSQILRKDGIIKEYIETKYVDLLFKTLVDKSLQRYCSRATAYQRILILYALQIWYFNIGK
ncbi:MAG: asparagine synthase (glutamine-hydrolyzing) [Cyclobacteriaceae bacterium]|nr:MAG: asparagine synthase (glutamine-hydrolyzing) [Cyclobacteriaceae bacterium]